MNIIKHIFCKDLCFVINEYVMISKYDVITHKNNNLTDLLLQFDDFNYISPFKMMYKSNVKEEPSMTKYIRFMKGLERYRRNKDICKGGICGCAYCKNIIAKRFKHDYDIK